MSCHAMAFGPVVWKVKNYSRNRASKCITGAWETCLLSVTETEEADLVWMITGSFFVIVVRALNRQLSVFVGQSIGVCPTLKLYTKWGEISETDSMFASYFSEACHSLYLSVPHGPITDQQQCREYVWNIMSYVCYIVIIYDVCNVIRINVCVCIYKWLSHWLCCPTLNGT